MSTLISKITLGSIESLRVSGVPNSSITAPAGSIAYDLKTGKKYSTADGSSWTEISKPTIPSPSNVPLHSSRHIRGAADEIDGDRLDIDFIPTSYTPTTTGTGISSVTSAQHLAAHLKGIDDALSVPGPQGPPGTGGLPVLNVLTDLAGLTHTNGTLFLDRYGNPLRNASFSNGSTTEGEGDAIQGAIDYFIEYPEKYHSIYIPPGVYSISKPLIIAAPGKFVACEILGSNNQFPQGGGKMGGPIIRWRYPLPGTTARFGVDQAMLIIQGARRVSVKGIEFFGQNLSAQRADEDLHNGLFKYGWDDYIDSDIRDNPFSPACCVAIDPFMNASPGGLESNMYPGLESYYNFGKPKFVTVDGEKVETHEGTYQISSSNIKFENCSFLFNSFGTVISPAGPSGSIDLTLDDSYNNRGQFIAPKWIPTADKTANAENFSFVNCNWNWNRVAYSTGQSQARQNCLHSPRMASGYIAIDTEMIAQPSPAVPPIISGAPNIYGFKYIFNLNLGAGQGFHCSNLYAEWCASIGKINFGLNSELAGAKFTGCDIWLATPAAVGTAVKNTQKAVPFHFWQGDGYVEFDRCSIACFDDDILRFQNRQRPARLKFNMCQISPGYNTKANNITKQKLGFSKPFDVKMNEVNVLSRASLNSGTGAAIVENIGIVGLEQPPVFSKVTLGWINNSGVGIVQSDALGKQGTFEFNKDIFNSKKLRYFPDLTENAVALVESPDISAGDILHFTLNQYFPELLWAIPHPVGGMGTVSGNADGYPTIQQSQGTTLSSYRYSYNGPFGVISNIQDKPGDSSKLVITVKDLPDGFPFGMPICVDVTRFGWNMGSTTVACQPPRTIIDSEMPHPTSILL